MAERSQQVSFAGDWKIRSGSARGRFPLELPAILGRDASGEVVAIGPGVSRLRVGARVTGLVTTAFAERVVAKEDAWAEVPARLDLVDAAAIPLVALTGSQLIEEAVRPGAGETLRVTGALGSVGRVAVFTARACLPIAKRMPLAQIREAQVLAEKGNIGGKIVLVV